MWRVFLPIVAAGWFAATAVAAETRWRDQFLLITPSKIKDQPGLASLGQNLESLGIVPDSDIAKFLNAATFDQWKVFEDEHVRFSYPDFPGMTVEVSSRANPKPVPVYGAPLRTESYHYAQVYRVALGKLTYALLFLQKAEHLDNGMCFCGAVVHRGMFVHDGCLYEYALLQSGELKSMQVLGDGWRAQLFEWTHSLMTPSMYLSLAESVVLKHPHPRSEEEWREFLRNEPERTWTELSWMRRGMDRKSVIQLLGNPARQAKASLEYERINKELLSKQTLRVPFTDGIFREFTKGSWRYEEIPPDRGTLEWARQFANSLNGQKPKRGPTVAKDAKLAMDLFLKEAPQAVGRYWRDWCQVASDLASAGVKDPRVPKIVEPRYLDPTLESDYAASILQAYKAKNAQDLFRQRIRIDLDEAAKSADASSGNLHNLLVYLDPSEARAPFVREALVHPRETIRSEAVYFLDSLPRKQAYAAAIRGLEDSYIYMRSGSARALRQFGSAADVPLLETKLTDEKNKDLRKDFEEAITALKKEAR